MGYNEDLEQIISAKKKMLPYLSGPALHSAVAEIAFLSHYLNILKNKEKDEEQKKITLQNVAMANYEIDQEKRIEEAAKECEKISRILGLSPEEPVSEEYYDYLMNPGSFERERENNGMYDTSHSINDYEDEEEKDVSPAVPEKKPEVKPNVAKENNQSDEWDEEEEAPKKKDFQSILRGYRFLEQVKSLHESLKETLKDLEEDDSKLSEESRFKRLAFREYEEMKAALAFAVKASDEANEDASPDRLFTALDIYQKKADAYAKKRKALEEANVAGAGQNVILTDEEEKAEKTRLRASKKWQKKAKDLFGKLKSALRGLHFSDLESPESGNSTDSEALPPKEVFKSFSKYREYLGDEVVLNDYNPEDFKEENRTGKWFREDDYDWMFSGERKVPQNNQGPNRKEEDANLDGFVIYEDPWYQEIPEEQWEMIREDSGMSMAEGYSKRFSSEADALASMLESNPNGGYAPSSADAAQTVFVLWLMGHKGFGLDAVTRFAGGPLYNKRGEIVNADELATLSKLREEFVQFCKDNPTTGAEAGNPEKYKASAENWANCFKHATNRIKEYKLPEIDYTDKNQVLEHIDEFVMLSKLGFYFEKEVPIILGGDNLSVPVKDIASTVLGGKKEYRNMISDWNAIKCVMNPISKGFADAPVPENVKGMRLCDFAAGVGHVSAYRAMAGKVINPYAGMKLSDVTKEAKTKSLYLFGATEDVAGWHTANSAQRIVYKDFMGFYLGRDRDSFLKTVEKEFDMKSEEARQLAKEDVVEAASRMISYTFGEMRTRLLETGDDPAAMRELIKGQIENRSVRAWIDDSFCNKIMTDREQAVLACLGLEASDAFLFDGKTAAELWGEKYADVEDPVEKETLLQAEILKKIAIGDSRIQLKDWEIGEDGELIPVAPITVLEKKEKLKEILDFGSSYKIMLQEGLREFQTIQDTLSLTQKNPAANRKGSANKEGSPAYQEMCLCLDQVVRDLDGELFQGKGNAYRTEIHLQKLFIAAQNYKKECKGIHPGSPEETCFKCAEQLIELFSVYDERIQTYRNAIDSSLSIDGRNYGDITDAPFIHLMSKMNKIARFLAVPVPTDEEAAKKYAQDALVRKQWELSGMKIHGKHHPKENYEKAVEFLKTEIANLCKEGTAGIEDIRKYDHLNEEIERLAGNPAFKTIMDTSPKFALENWRNIERATGEKASEYVTNVAMIKADYTTFSNYLAGIEHPMGEEPTEDAKKQMRTDARQALNDLMAYVNDGEGNKYVKEVERKKVYKKLTGLILDQILAQEESGFRLRQEAVAEEISLSKGIRLGGRTYNEMFKWTFNLLEGGKVLEGNKLSSTLKYLDQGELKTQIQKELSRNFVDNNNRAGLQAEIGRKL